jgi:hypothetical protein
MPDTIFQKLYDTIDTWKGSEKLRKAIGQTWLDLIRIFIQVLTERGKDALIELIGIIKDEAESAKKSPDS